MPEYNIKIPFKIGVFIALLPLIASACSSMYEAKATTTPTSSPTPVSLIDEVFVATPAPKTEGAGQCRPVNADFLKNIWDIDRPQFLWESIKGKNGGNIEVIGSNNQGKWDVIFDYENNSAWVRTIKDGEDAGIVYYGDSSDLELMDMQYKYIAEKTNLVEDTSISVAYGGTLADTINSYNRVWPEHDGLAFAQFGYLDEGGEGEEDDVWGFFAMPDCVGGGGSKFSVDVYSYGINFVVFMENEIKEDTYEPLEHFYFFVPIDQKLSIRERKIFEQSVQTMTRIMQVNQSPIGVINEIMPALLDRIGMFKRITRQADLLNKLK